MESSLGQKTTTKHEACCEVWLLYPLSVKKTDFSSSSRCQLIDFCLGVWLCLHFFLNVLICFIFVCMCHIYALSLKVKGSSNCLMLELQLIVRLSVNSGNRTLVSPRGENAISLQAISPALNLFFLKKKQLGSPLRDFSPVLHVF